MKNAAANNEEVSNKILTVPNAISLARLLLIPVYFVLLFHGHKVWALVCFAVSCATDFLDGQVARRTHQVSRLGQLMDPAIDTLLLVSGVIGSCAFCGLPLWVVIVVFLRELYLLVNGAWLLKLKGIRIPVVYAGKAATAILMVGICLTFIANWGVYVVYVGVAMQILVAVYYTWRAAFALKEQSKNA